jgi:hypothetical protein
MLDTRGANVGSGAMGSACSFQAKGAAPPATVAHHARSSESLSARLANDLCHESSVIGTTASHATAALPYSTRAA